MIRFFTIFRAKRNPNEWVTHGMMPACHVGDTWHDACMPGGCVHPIKSELVEEKRGRKKIKYERKGERKEDLAASSFDFRCSDGRSSSSQELKSVYSMRAML